VTWGCWHNYQPDTDGTVFCLEGSCQLDLHALVRLSNALNQQLPGLVEAG
jgi:hypothetical protein